MDQASAAGFGSSPRGFELRNIAGGWRIYSRADFADIVGKYVLEGQTARLTQAALETLAVIAYRQPVSRARVSAIRGVNVDSVVRTLAQRGLIEDSGTDPESGAMLYRTTSYFLERMGIGSVTELPQLSPHLPGLDGIAEYYDAEGI
jgi:segregation and condensation protein B